MTEKEKSKILKAVAQLIDSDMLDTANEILAKNNLSMNDYLISDSVILNDESLKMILKNKDNFDLVSLMRKPKLKKEFVQKLLSGLKEENYNFLNGNENGENIINVIVSEVLEKKFEADLSWLIKFVGKDVVKQEILNNASNSNILLNMLKEQKGRDIDVFVIMLDLIDLNDKDVVNSKGIQHILNSKEIFNFKNDLFIFKFANKFKENSNEKNKLITNYYVSAVLQGKVAEISNIKNKDVLALVNSGICCFDKSLMSDKIQEALERKALGISLRSFMGEDFNTDNIKLFEKLGVFVFNEFISAVPGYESDLNSFSNLAFNRVRNKMLNCKNEQELKDLLVKVKNYLDEGYNLSLKDKNNPNLKEDNNLDEFLTSVLSKIDKRNKNKFFDPDIEELSFELRMPPQIVARLLDVLDKRYQRKGMEVERGEEVNEQVEEIKKQWAEIKGYVFIGVKEENQKKLKM